MTDKPRTRKPKVKETLVEELPTLVPQEQGPVVPSNPIIDTVSEIALVLEGMFSQLSDKLRQAGHPDPEAGAKEMLGAGYNVALVSIAARTATAPLPKLRLAGFNR